MDIQSYISSGVIEAYVMGLATEEEIQILQCVQKHNAEVRQAVLDAELALEGLATQQAVPPPAHLKAAIWSALQEDVSEQKESETETQVTSGNTTAFIPATPEVTANHNKQNFFRPLAIAASLLLLVSLSGLVYLMREQNEMKTALAAAQKEQLGTKLAYNQLQQKWDMSSNPEMKTVMLKGVEKHPGMKAMVYVDNKTKQTYLSLENLPPAPKDKQYQLWAIVDGKPVDAGMYNEQSGEMVQKMYIIEHAQAFAITLEKAGGSPTPTMEEMYVMGEI